MIQDVDSSSLEANYQSFASLMEQRLAELFLVAGRQGSQTARSRRATTVGMYTVQVGGNEALMFAPVQMMTSLQDKKITVLNSAVLRFQVPVITLPLPTLHFSYIFCSM